MWLTAPPATGIYGNIGSLWLSKPSLPSSCCKFLAGCVAQWHTFTIPRTVLTTSHNSTESVFLFWCGIFAVVISLLEWHFVSLRVQPAPLELEEPYRCPRALSSIHIGLWLRCFSHWCCSLFLNMLLCLSFSHRFYLDLLHSMTFFGIFFPVMAFTCSGSLDLALDCSIRCYTSDEVVLVSV